MGEALMPRRGGVKKNGFVIETDEYKPSSARTIYTDDTVITSHTFGNEALSGEFFLYGSFPGNIKIVLMAFDAPIEYSNGERTYRVWANLEGNLVRVYGRVIVGSSVSFTSQGIYFGFY